MIFFDRLLSLFSEHQTHAHVQGPAVARARRDVRTSVTVEPIEAQMAREMDEFDKAPSNTIRERDVSAARAAIRGGMPIKHVRSMYGEAVLERAQGSLRTSH